MVNCRRGIGIPEIVIIVGLLLIFISGFLPETPKEKGDIYIAVKEIGTLAPSYGDVVHIKLAPKVLLGKGVEGTPLLVETDRKEVAKGIITTKEHTIEFDIPSDYYSKLQSVNMKLFVEDSNFYGALIVYLNGQKIWSGYPKLNTPLLIDLPKNLLKEGENIIRLSAASSGWRIWEPTYYIISYIEIGEKLNLREEASFNFTVSPGLLSKYSYARVYAGNIKPMIPGELAIILNGENVIYTGVPASGSFIASFYYPLNEENTITFKLLENGYYEIDNLEVILFTSKNASDSSYMEFSLPEEHLKDLRKGKYNLVIEIEVLSSDGKEPLTVKLLGNGEHVIYRGIASEGKIVLTVPSSHVAQRNILRFESRGKYTLGNVVVKLVKK